jgi:hypothetical protein
VCVMELYCALEELHCALGDFFGLRSYVSHCGSYFVRYGVIL